MQTIKANVLQYDKSGNKVITKRVNVTKYVDGVYLGETKIINYEPECNVYFECNGVYWYSFHEYANDLQRPDAKDLVTKIRENYFTNIEEAARSNKFISLLDLEVYKALNLDVAPLLAARAEFLRKESERQKAENAERQRKEAERIENEKRAKLAKIEKAEKDMIECKEITAEQIELLAEKYGVKIHIRTLGLIRSKLHRAVFLSDGRVGCSGYGLTQNNINGVCNVMHEIKEAICKASVDKICKEKNLTHDELLDEISADPIFAD